MNFRLWFTVNVFLLYSTVTAQTNTPWPTSGNVGIGTTTPRDKLEVLGNVVADGFNAVGGLSRYNAGGGLFVIGNAGTPWGVIGAYGDASGTPKILALNPSGGNVGIGTSNPVTKLDVSGALRSGGSRPVTIDGGTAMIYGQGDAGGWAFGYHAKGSVGADKGGFGFLGGADSLLYYYIGSNFDRPTMIVQPGNGNVGIGTTNPTQKLSVNGNDPSQGSDC